MEQPWALSHPRAHRFGMSSQKYGATITVEGDEKDNLLDKALIFSSNVALLRKIVDDHNLLIKYKEKYGELNETKG
jgi:hypothetical protein